MRIIIIILCTLVSYQIATAQEWAMGLHRGTHQQSEVQYDYMSGMQTERFSPEPVNYLWGNVQYAGYTLDNPPPLGGLTLVGQNPYQEIERCNCTLYLRVRGVTTRRYRIPPEEVEILLRNDPSLARPGIHSVTPLHWSLSQTIRIRS